jgi:enoyl-CoA hydratase
VIDIERNGAVHVVRLNRGPVNALDVDMLDALTETMRDLQGPVVLTGNGRVFSAGVDLRRVLAEDADYAAALLAALSAGFQAVFDHPGPTVAAIDGSAIAGGCMFALACDVRFMSGGRIGLTELAVGVPFPVAGLEIARYVLGDAARRVILRGESFDPQEALELGLIDEHVAPEALHERARTVAAQLWDRSPETYELVKHQLHGRVSEAIDASPPGADAAAATIWAARETRERIDRQLAELARRREPSPSAGPEE